MGGDTHTFASTGTFRKCPNIFNPQRNTYYSTVLHTALHTHTYFMKSSFFNPQKVRRLIIIFIYLSSIIIISPVEMKVCVWCIYQTINLMISVKESSLSPIVIAVVLSVKEVVSPFMGRSCVPIKGRVTST